MSSNVPEQGRLCPAASPRVSVSGPDRPPGSVPAARDTTSVAAAVDPVGWILVRGGRLPDRPWHRAQRVADLWWAAAPLSCGSRPVTGVTLRQAERLAALVGGRVPTSPEWEWMASAGHRLYPWGEQEPTAAHANLRASGPGTTTAVRGHRAGRTPEGLWDVAGNVWEWTRAPGRRHGAALLRGGSYNSLAQYAACTHANDVPPDLSSPGIGVRPVRDTPPILLCPSIGAS